MGGEQLAEELLAARRSLLRVVEGMPDEDLRRTPAQGEWAVIEVLAHLVDVDRHWLREALAIRDDPQHCFEHFDDEKWKAEHPNARSIPLAKVLSDLEASFGNVIDELRGLSHEQLERLGRHPRGVPYRVRDVFLRYPPHDGNHTEQVRAIAGGRQAADSGR